ncbi:hypothetical protein J2Y02_001476 [Neobacillus drentensis]|nr:hypothetical protein [Neobacillus drentensis]
MIDTFTDCREGVFFSTIFYFSVLNYSLSLLMGLLISSPGTPAESEVPGVPINRHVQSQYINELLKFLK